MKIQAQSSRALHAALNKSSKCVDAQAAMAILSDALLTCDDEGRFFLTSSNGDAQLTFPVPLILCGGSFSAPIVLPVKRLSSLLGTLSDCVVTMDVADNGVLTVEYCTGDGDNVKPGKFSMTYQPGNEFPKIVLPKSGDKMIINLPLPLFRSCVDAAANFVSREEFQRVLSCLCIDVAEDRSEVALMASNGHTLSKAMHSNDPQRGGSDFFRSGEPRKTLIHRNFFRALSAFDGDEYITIEDDGHTIRFSSGDTEFICKHVEGIYPTYNSAIPKSSPYYVVFNKKEMLEVLKRVSLFASMSSNLVRVEKNGMFLTISASDADFALSGEDHVCIADAQCKEHFYIGLNASSFQTCLNAIPSGTIRMQMSAPDRAVVLTPNDPAPQVLSLCMPLLLND